MTFTIPRIVLDPVTVTQGQHYAVFRPRLVGADGSPATAPQMMTVSWTTKGGWSDPHWTGADYVSRSGVLTWAAGNTHPNEGDIVVQLGDASRKAAKTYAPLSVELGLGGGSGAYPGYTDVSAACTVQVGADAARPAIWSLFPITQAQLDAIRPTGRGLTSTFGWGNAEDGETGVDIYNGQIAGLKPFTLSPDGRVHLRCFPLPAPVRDSAGRMKGVGQARLICPVVFQKGDLIEMDVAHVSPGWLIAPWTAGGGWPRGGEVDMEYRPDWCGAHGLNLAQHYPGASGAGLGGVTQLPDIDLTQPHIRSIEWTPDDQIVYRVNGIERQRQPMLWNGAAQQVIAQATAYLSAKDAMPELSLGGWTHYRAKSA